MQLKIVLKEETPSRTSDRQSPNFMQRDIWEIILRDFWGEFCVVWSQLRARRMEIGELEHYQNREPASKHLSMCNTSSWALWAKDSVISAICR